MRSLVIILFELNRYLFHGSHYSLSRINFGGKRKEEFQVNITNFSISIDHGKKRVYLVRFGVSKNIIMSMDYDGRNKKTRLETGERIVALAVFGGTMYWQKLNTDVIHVINATTRNIDKEISLPKQ